MTIQSVRESLHQPLISNPPLKQCEVIAIVPVKDEAQTLAATIAEIASGVDAVGGRILTD